MLHDLEFPRQWEGVPRAARPCIEGYPGALLSATRSEFTARARGGGHGGPPRREHRFGRG